MKYNEKPLFDDTEEKEFLVILVAIRGYFLNAFSTLQYRPSTGPKALTYIIDFDPSIQLESVSYFLEHFISVGGGERILKLGWGMRVPL